MLLRGSLFHSLCNSHKGTFKMMQPIIFTHTVSDFLKRHKKLKILLSTPEQGSHCARRLTQGSRLAAKCFQDVCKCAEAEKCCSPDAEETEAYSQGLRKQFSRVSKGVRIEEKAIFYLLLSSFFTTTSLPLKRKGKKN